MNNLFFSYCTNIFLFKTVESDFFRLFTPIIYLLLNLVIYFCLNPWPPHAHTRAYTRGKREGKLNGYSFSSAVTHKWSKNVSMYHNNSTYLSCLMPPSPLSHFSGNTLSLNSDSMQIWITFCKCSPSSKTFFFKFKVNYHMVYLMNCTRETTTNIVLWPRIQFC